MALPASAASGAAAAGSADARADLKRNVARTQHELAAIGHYLRGKPLQNANFAAAEVLAASARKTTAFRDVTGNLRRSFKAVRSPRRYFPAAAWRAWSRRAPHGWNVERGHGPPKRKGGLGPAASPRKGGSPRRGKAARARREAARRYALARQGQRRRRGGRTPPHPFVEDAIRRAVPLVDPAFRASVERDLPGVLAQARRRADQKRPRA